MRTFLQCLIVFLALVNVVLYQNFYTTTTKPKYLQLEHTVGLAVMRECFTYNQPEPCQFLAQANRAVSVPVIDATMTEREVRQEYVRFIKLLSVEVGTETLKYCAKDWTTKLCQLVRQVKFRDMA